MKIWVNCIVRNEENFIWYALMSVVDHVDKILVWDTGSDDATADIIAEVKKIKGSKIEYKQVGRQDKEGYTKMRQKMLEESDCDWILILDGDEVWWEDSIRQLRQKIEKENKDICAVAVPFYNLTGDIYHYQSEAAGQYKILGKKGHLTIKAVRKIPKLHWEGPYGKEGLFDEKETALQDRINAVIFYNLPFLHFTHLKRSRSKIKKFKYDLGIRFAKDFIFPEVLHKKAPEYLTSPWGKRSLCYELISQFKKPIQFVWRKIINYE